MGVAEEALDNAINGAAKGGLRSAVEGAADAPGASIQDVGVDHRRAHVLVAEQLLHRADVVAVFEQMGGERVPESCGRSRVWRWRRRGGRPAQHAGRLFREGGGAAARPCSVEVAIARGGETAIAMPQSRDAAGCLRAERVRELDGTVPGGQIGVVLRRTTCRVARARGTTKLRHDRSPIASALAVAHEDLSPRRGRRP